MNRHALAALLGLVIGLGLGLMSNVSGVVLGLYGFVIALLFAYGTARSRRTTRVRRGP